MRGTTTAIIIRILSLEGVEGRLRTIHLSLIVWSVQLEFATSFCLTRCTLMPKAAAVSSSVTPLNDFVFTHLLSRRDRCYTGRFRRIWSVPPEWLPASLWWPVGVLRRHCLLVRRLRPATRTICFIAHFPSHCQSSLNINAHFRWCVSIKDQYHSLGYACSVWPWQQGEQQHR